MPTYEYVCDHCGYEFERFQSMKDDPITICPECDKKKVRRLLGTGAGIIFKGSGFYETDYKRKSGSNAGSSNADSSSNNNKADTGNQKNNNAKSEAKNTESKSSKSGNGKEAA